MRALGALILRRTGVVFALKNNVEKTLGHN